MPTPYSGFRQSQRTRSSYNSGNLGHSNYFQRIWGKNTTSNTFWRMSTTRPRSNCFTQLHSVGSLFLVFIVADAYIAGCILHLLHSKHCLRPHAMARRMTQADKGLDKYNDPNVSTELNSLLVILPDHYRDLSDVPVDDMHSRGISPKSWLASLTR